MSRRRDYFNWSIVTFGRRRFSGNFFDYFWRLFFCFLKFFLFRKGFKLNWAIDMTFVGSMGGVRWRGRHPINRCRGNSTVTGGSGTCIGIRNTQSDESVTDWVGFGFGGNSVLNCLWILWTCLSFQILWIFHFVDGSPRFGVFRSWFVTGVRALRDGIGALSMIPVGISFRTLPWVPVGTRGRWILRRRGGGGCRFNSSHHEYFSWRFLRTWKNERLNWTELRTFWR